MAQFKTAVKPALDARAAIAELELQLAAARVARDNADVAASAVVSNVVNRMKGDPESGENSPLYASFGYVRKDDRKSGLTRIVTQPATVPAITAPVTLKAAA